MCYLGIDSQRFAFSDECRDPFVLSTGEFIERKGVEFIIRAVAATMSRPLLVWVANRADAGYLERAKIIRAIAGSGPGREAAGIQDLVRLYQRATAFVYAPLLEPFGLSPLEACACGTPVIAVAEGGVRETIRPMESGLLVERDPAHMAVAINRLMGDEATARQLGRKGAGNVREAWTLEAATERLEGHLLAVSARERVHP